MIALVFMLLASIVGIFVLRRKLDDALNKIQLICIEKYDYESKYEISQQLLEQFRNSSRMHQQEAQKLRDSRTGHTGDLTAEQEAELLSRLDEVLAENDTLLDQLDSLKKDS